MLRAGQFTPPGLLLPILSTMLRRMMLTDLKYFRKTREIKYLRTS